jgi:NADPH:quinone reductase
MRAIQLTETGGPEVLRLVELPAPSPGPGEILVRNHAIALNFIDTYQRKGLYKLPLPSGMGSEGAGTVEQLGEGVEGVSVGDRVAYYGPKLGAYADLFSVAADRAVPLPADIPFEIAAGAMMKGMTAHAFLTQTYRVKAGDTILVHAAAGGVGSIMAQMAKSLGAVVIGTVGSKDKLTAARENGCEHVILYGEEDVAARVRDITGGQGVRAAYDSVGAATFEGSLNSLGRRGWLVSFGNASGPAPAIAPLRLMNGGSLVLTRPTVGDFVSTRAELLDTAGSLFGQITSGAVKIHIGQRFALADAAEAHRVMESRSTLGASILQP